MHFIFSLNTGRCGTHAVANAFNACGGPEVLAIHENIGVDHHGVVTPDVGLLRRFNTHGYASEAREFWDRRAAVIVDACLKAGKSLYIETAHMLGKAGLVEWVAENSAQDGASDVGLAFINVTRRPEAVARSIAERGELVHLANRWLWFLDPAYPKNRVAYEPYAPFPQLGAACWYVAEMRARIAEYEGVLAEHGVPVLQIDIDDPALTGRVLAFLEEQGLAGHFPEGLRLERSNVNPPRAGRERIEAECKRILEQCGAL